MGRRPVAMLGEEQPHRPQQIDARVIRQRAERFHQVGLDIAGMRAQGLDALSLARLCQVLGVLPTYLMKLDEQPPRDQLVSLPARP